MEPATNLVSWVVGWVFIRYLITFILATTSDPKLKMRIVFNYACTKLLNLWSTLLILIKKTVLYVLLCLT